MNATPLAQLLPDAASLINEVVDVLRAILRDTSATAETRRRAAASLLHFLVPRPSTRPARTSTGGTPVTPREEGRGDRPDQSTTVAAPPSSHGEEWPDEGGTSEGSSRHEVACDRFHPHLIRARSASDGWIPPASPLVGAPSDPPCADGASESNHPHPTDDEDADDPRLTAALEILRLARSDIELDEDDDECNDIEDSSPSPGATSRALHTHTSVTNSRPLGGKLARGRGPGEELTGSESCVESHFGDEQKNPVALLALLQRRREEAAAIRARLARPDRPGKLGDPKKAESAGPNTQPSPGAVAERCSATNTRPHPITPSPTHSLPGPAP